MLTVHHLGRSQSERILFLLEELSVPYELVHHKRDPLLAPPSLKSLHSQGTAPIIVDGDLVLAESGAIAQYIINKYGGGRLTIAHDAPAYTTYLYWLYFVLCTLQPSGSQVMMVYFDSSLPDDGFARTFTRDRFRKNLATTDKRLGEAPFLAGEEFTLADVMAVYIFTTFRNFLPYSLKPYPNILGYVGRLTEREAYKRAWAKGEPEWEGNKGPEPEKKAVL